MTRKTVQAYFDALSAGGDWPAFLAEGMTFASHAAPRKQVAGRDAFLESTSAFYSMIEEVELRQLIVEGDRACAVARYRLRPPVGDAFTCDVAELFTVTAGRIASFEIHFDSAPFPARPGGL